ncbi:MAG: carbamoyltransferase [Pyrinomonadaceae bacterium]
MLVLGLSGGFGLPGERFIPNLPVWFFHDSAACLVRDGHVLTAVEEERVNRIKHTNMLPAGAAGECLKISGVSPAAIDLIAYFFREEYADNELDLQYIQHPELPLRHARELLSERLSEFFGITVPLEKLRFVRHHQCHATAAFFHSGFEASLIAILDGNGEDESISIYSTDGKEMTLSATYPTEKSLGHFYSSSIELLGYSLFDEYKVMGLAPYGDPAVYRDQFRSLYSLGAGGDYELNVERVRSHFLRRRFVPRRRGQPFDESHANFAAALQETLEVIAGHVISFWARETGQQNLCLAGGVANNSRLNGLLARNGPFERIFVHPGVHDGGSAVGAALEVSRIEAPSNFKPKALRSAYWGSDLGTPAQQEALLTRWSDFFEFRRCADAPAEAARLIADGAVLGWAQGRMEFGPRALGNRSILADPRPIENRDRINAAVKKREGYRPFAPAVVAEEAHRYFELPPTVSEFPFMSITVPVQPDKRELLGAVTHVDGSARIQTVSRDQNPRFWRLIERFGQITGVAVVLNTSFNTSVEPIVRTAGEALLCFLTTDLDYLFIDDWVVRRRRFGEDKLLELVPALNVNVELSESRLAMPFPGDDVGRKIAFTYSKGRSMPLSAEMYHALKNADGRKSFRDCLGGDLSDLAGQSASLEIRRLLDGRFIDIRGLDVDSQAT